MVQDPTSQDAEVQGDEMHVKKTKKRKLMRFSQWAMNTQFRQFITGNDNGKITRRQCCRQNWCSRVTKWGMPDSFLSSRGCGVGHEKCRW